MAHGVLGAAARVAVVLALNFVVGAASHEAVGSALHLHLSSKLAPACSGRADQVSHCCFHCGIGRRGEREGTGTKPRTDIEFV